MSISLVAREMPVPGKDPLGESAASPLTGVGGNQILVEDPAGNPVELFQPTRQEARL
jgi:hypothetical protein